MENIVEKISAMSNKDANHIKDMNRLENVNSIFTIPEKHLNLNSEAIPFYPSPNQSKSDESITSASSSSSDKFKCSLQKSSKSDESISGASSSSSSFLYSTFKLKISLESEIWKSIAACTATENKSSISALEAKARDNLNLSRSFIGSAFNQSFAMEISPDGLIHIIRKDNILIKISLDQAIRVEIPRHKIQLNVSNSAMAASLLHPNGRILQDQDSSRVDIVCYDGNGKNNYVRYAKMWYKGVSFSSREIPIAYLVDEAGLRTSKDRFSDISERYAFDAFAKNILYGPRCRSDAVEILQKCDHSLNFDNSETIVINHIRIQSFIDGTISIQRQDEKCTLRFNPRKLGATMTTEFMHCTASMGKAPHLFLRQGDRRIYFDGTTFCVRNGGHSAGFDENNKVTIFNKKSLLTNEDY